MEPEQKSVKQKWHFIGTKAHIVYFTRINNMIAVQYYAVLHWNTLSFEY